MNWDDYFIQMTDFVATKSKDRSTKVGCVIVGPDNEIVSTGFNGFPRGVDDCCDEKHERPEKYFWTEHAERNAIYNAALIGAKLKDCRIYVNYFPCIDCARGIVQSGIKEVIFKNDIMSEKWTESFDRSGRLFDQVGIVVRKYVESD